MAGEAATTDTGTQTATTGADTGVTKTDTGTGAKTDTGASTSTGTGTVDTTTKTTDTVTAAADWRAGMEGDLRDFAGRYTTPVDLAKAALDLRKANSSMVKIPAKDAAPEDIAKFRKAIGVPEKAEEYKFDIGREATDADKVVQSKIADVFLANGVPAAAAPAISKAVADMATEMLNEQNRVAVQARDNSQAALKKEWGADYDANLTLASRAVQQFASPDTKDFLEKTIVNGAKLGDHPEIIRLFGQVGRRMGEGDFIGAVGTDQRASIQAQIDQIMTENPVGTPKYSNPAIQAKLQSLHEQLHGTGSSARVAGR